MWIWGEDKLRIEFWKIGFREGVRKLIMHSKHTEENSLEATACSSAFIKKLLLFS